MESFCIAAHGNGYQVDLEQLKSRGPLLSTYLVHDQTLEVQSLYALQNVMHNLQHPPSTCKGRLLELPFSAFIVLIYDLSMLINFLMQI